MGNVESHPGEDPITGQHKSKSFPGSAIVDSLIAPCGSLKDTLDGTTTSSSPNQPHGISKLLNQAEALCIQSPSSDAGNGSHSQFDDEYEDFRKDKENFEGEDGAGGSLKDRFRPPNSPGNPTSALFARALVSEVTDNPKTMTPHAMAEREKKLLKAQERARMAKKTGDLSRPVGVPGGVGNPSVMGSIAHALTGTTDPLAAAQAQAAGIRASVMPPNSMSENRAQVDSNNNVASSNGDHQAPPGKYTITIGLSLTRRSSAGHPDSVTRQTVFDFNELQDREYKYVSSTDSSGWRAGGGERGEDATLATAGSDAGDDSDFSGGHGKPAAAAAAAAVGAPSTPTGAAQKAPAPDTVHIPIIHIDAESPEAIDEIISALARGEVFIPHMAIMPEALSVDGVSPPDLVVRFGTERNEDLPPDEWPNWCLEFMHNQLYEYFYGMGARWMKRPFSITLAKKVRWKTVKHMNRYFAHAERVIDAWREKGPQYLDPQLSYIEDGATPEEVARPHGIYLMRNGVPTNYFAPNFDPPYTTKMTRSLLLNVLGKSWDKKRREWTSEPVPRLVTPGMLMTAMCGCGDSNAGGFIANEVTLKNKIDTSAIPIEAKIRSSDPGPSKQHHRPSSLQQAQNTPSQRHHQHQQQQQQQSPRAQQHQQQQQQYPPQTPAGTEAADTDIVSEPVGQMTPSRHAAPDEDASAAATPQSFQQLNLHVSSSSHEEGEGSEASSAMLSPRYGVPAASPDHFASSSPATNNNNNNTDRYAMSVGQQGGAKQDLDVSMDTSDNVQASVTNTNSTIMHMNLSAEKFMKRVVGREEKKEDPETLASDEDWLDSLGKPLQSPAVNTQAQFSSTEKNRVKQALEKERARQIALVSIANEQSANRSQTNPMIRPVEDHGSSRSSGALMTVDTQQGKKTPKDASPSINKNNSGVSLDYSVDSASFLGGDGSTMGGSSLLGGKYATDGSVATAATKETWASNARKKQDPLALSANEHNHHHAHTNARDDDEVSGFSLQESTSSAEAVPSDEELFAVGWAKALDPKSGSYYFFTLDRTKIVWDNPLAPAASASSHRGASVDSADTGSLPPGSALI